MSQPYSMVFVNLIASLLFALGVVIWKYVLHKKVNLFVLLILISILPIWSIFRVGTYEAGDLTLHTNFLRSFYENIKDGILIPRWAGGLCAGYGCPVFMFEYVMPYYIGALFHFLGFSFLNSMKLFLASTYILSGITMFFFLKEHLNEKASFIGALLYLFAPIRFIEMHFRVSVGTDAAFIFIPLAFLFAKKTVEGNKLYIAFGAINFLLLILSHSSPAFIVIIAAALYGILISKNIKGVILLLFSFILGVGLSSYYALPALWENKHTWYSLFQIPGDFHPIQDYLFSPARFGLLFQGNNGEIRPIIGYAQLMLFFLGIFYLVKDKLDKKYKKIVVYLLTGSIFLFLMMLSFTKPIWENIFFLKTFIISWRMLVPISFILAFLGAIVVKKWNFLALILISLIIIFSTILNWGNRKMVSFPTNAYENESMLYTEYIEYPLKGYYSIRFQEGIKKINYTPNYILEEHSAPLNFISGKGDIKEIARTQIKHEYLINVTEPSVLSENTFYFPGWKLFINNKDFRFDIKDKRSFGTMVFKIPKGTYLLSAEFQDTNIMKLGNTISLISLLIVLIILLSNPFKTYSRALNKY